MATITLTFQHELNVSVQIGDVVYYVDTDPVGIPRAWASTTTPHMTKDRESVIMIGPVVDITIIPPELDPLGNLTPIQSIITADFDDIIAAQYGPPDEDSFIMFSKDNKVNLSSAAGYYASVTFKNDSKDKAELFNVGTDMFESSK